MVSPPPFHKCVFLFPSGPFISGSVSLYSSNLASLSIRVAISLSAGTERGESKRVAVEIYHKWGNAPFHVYAVAWKGSYTNVCTVERLAISLVESCHRLGCKMIFEG